MSNRNGITEEAWRFLSDRESLATQDRTIPCVHNLRIETRQLVQSHHDRVTEGGYQDLVWQIPLHSIYRTAHDLTDLAGKGRGDLFNKSSVLTGEGKGYGESFLRHLH
ncbi:MAG: hypothetical protein HIU83_10000 [Proteobacteria bacterium]|nr:hypothetical protein [Pseudomonadota bacterium]